MAVFYVDKKNETPLKDDLKSFIDSENKVVPFDTETTGLDPFSCRLLLVQLKLGENIYVINREKMGLVFIKNMIDYLNKSGAIFLGHNIKFDAKVIKASTGIWMDKVYDTMIAECVITAGIGSKLYSLVDLVKKYCSVELSKDTRLTFINGDKPIDSFSQEQIDYAATDVLYLEELYSKQIDTCIKDNVKNVLDMEMKLVPVVCKMEFNGVKLDVEHWNNLTISARKRSKEFSIRLKKLIFDKINKSKYTNALEFARALSIPVKTKRDIQMLESIIDSSLISEWMIENFNINSHKQLLTALHLCGVKTPNTNEKTLNKLPKNDLIDAILDSRGEEKLISTYGDNIVELINNVTGRIHTEYFQCGTVTGRFSSENPNMQNLPRKGGYREGFVPADDFSYVSMDYSQQEFRLAGALSNEPKIIEAYKLGSDMHTATASNRFNKPLEEINSEERNFGKTMNFAILYGTTEYGLKRNFSITINEALEMLKNFFDGYPRLSAFKKLVEEKVLKLGYSITPMGRRRYFKPLPVFSSPQDIEKYEAQLKREGFNMVIQGGGADVTKLALLLLAERNPFGELFKLVLQVHDEIVAEVHDSIIDEAVEFMKNCMLEPFQPLLGEIPAKVDTRVSKRWGKG